jgi:hypothetical protein
MDKEPAYKKYIQYLATPWVIETVVFFMVMWQESFRLSSRTSHKILPIKKQIQDYYYYNFGDFVNGYIIAFIIDGVINLVLLKTDNFYMIFGYRITKKLNTLLATLISIFIVVIFELLQSASTTSDIKDIPAGIMGAISFYCIRLIALQLTDKFKQTN